MFVGVQKQSHRAGASHRALIAFIRAYSYWGERPLAADVSCSSNHLMYGAVQTSQSATK